MNKKILSVLIALTLVFGFAGIALANTGALADFNAFYPNAGATYSCTLCHVTPGDTGNPYGAALVAQGGTANAIADAAFLAVENVDSDGDTFTNLAEILAGSWPGNPNSVPGGGAGSVINITSPNGGEVIPSGAAFAITYDASADVNSVKVRYSLNGGATWLPAKDAGGSVIGSFNWAVPTPKKNKTKALVKVIGYNGAAKVDVDKSDAVFTIETVTITSPTTTDTLTGGGSFPITWTTNGITVDSFVLFYSTNNGLTWKRISKSAPGSGNPGTYTWDNTSERPIPSPAVPKPKSMIRLILKDNTGATVGIDASDKFWIQQ